jgi:adenylate kinase
LPKISTGDMLREGVREGHPIALEAKARMDRGELIDDRTIIAIVRDRLAKPDAKRGFVLDGFPRTVGQAEALDQIMRDRGDTPLIVIDVEVPPQELVRRLASRRICVKCGANAEPSSTSDTCPECGGPMEQRVDDNKDVVLERLNVYERSTKPVLEYYRERPTFRVVNGAQAPERVAHELDTMIDDAAGAKAL